MFEPVDNKRYSLPSPDSESLNGRRFCEFHNSPPFNAIQIDLWQRIHRAITSILLLHDLVDLRLPKGQYRLKIYLDEMSQVLKTNHIPLFEPGDLDPEPESLPVDTPCPGESFYFPQWLTSGCHISWFCSEYSWGYLRSLMVASMLWHDDRLLEWLKMVVEIRWNTELCDEYRAVLQDEDLFQWRNEETLPHQVYEHALMMVTDIQSMLAARQRCRSSKF